MNGSFARSVGPSSRYTVLAANVSKVLYALKHRRIAEVEQRLMMRAADLLHNIVQGSQFVERKDAHALSNPSENLFTVGHALAALRSLSEAHEQQAKQITKTFEDLETDLRRLSQGEELPHERLGSIAAFFDALRSFFYRDIADVAATRPEPIFEKPTR